MRKRPRVMFGAAVAIVAVALPAVAEGATYYAAQTGSGSECSSANPCSLDGAVTKADADMARDTVQVVGALTHTDAVVLSTPTDLVGSGRGDGGTFIDVGGFAVCALCIQATSTASNLRVRKTNAWDGVDMTAGTTLTDATVQGTENGVYLNATAAAEARIERSNLSTTNPIGPGLVTNVTHADSVLRVLDSTISGYRGMSLGGAGRTIVQRSVIDALLYGIELGNIFQTGNTRLSVSSSSIRLRPVSPAGAIEALRVVSSAVGQTASADIRQVTLDGSSVSNDHGIAAVASAGGTASATVRGSIARGFDGDLFTDGAGATITVGTSDFSTRSSATGTIDTTSLGGNVDVDPVYVDAASLDYRLKSSSPLIDQAGGDPIATDESPTDLAGAARIVDGNGDGVALRDIGAFESGQGQPGPGPAPQPPPTTVVQEPPAKTPPRGSKVTLGKPVTLPGGGQGLAFNTNGACAATVSQDLTRPVTLAVAAAKKKKKKPAALIKRVSFRVLGAGRHVAPLRLTPAGVRRVRGKSRRARAAAARVIVPVKITCQPLAYGTGDPSGNGLGAPKPTGRKTLVASSRVRLRDTTAPAAARAFSGTARGVGSPATDSRVAFTLGNGVRVTGFSATAPAVCTSAAGQTSAGSRPVTVSSLPIAIDRAELFERTPTGWRQVQVVFTSATKAQGFVREAYGPCIAEAHFNAKAS